MVLILKIFFELPFMMRAAILLLLLLLAWKLLGRPILWCLSLIPFLIDKAFLLLYQIVEIPIAILHKKIGAEFYKVENFMAGIGGAVDGVLNRWYTSWHTKHKFEWGKAIAIYILCLAFVALPAFVSVESSILKSGNQLYTAGEKILAGYVEKYEVQKMVRQASAGEGGQAASNEAETQQQEIGLVVINVKSSLLVRGAPNIDSGEVLEKLSNGETVAWTGELVFAEAEDHNMETWVKVKTKNGTVGWSRLSYLSPTDNEEREFIVRRGKTQE